MYIAIKLLLIAIVLLTSFLSWDFFSKMKKDKFIAFYVLCIALIAVNQILSYYSSSIETFPIFNTFIGYFLSPLIYFHCISLFKTNNLKKRAYQHFLASIPIMCIIVFWIFDDYRRKLLGYGNNSYITILLAVQFLFYALLLIQFLRGRSTLIIAIRHTLQYKRIRFAVLLFLCQIFIMVTMLIENFGNLDQWTGILVLFIFLQLMAQVVSMLFLQGKHPTFFTENDRPVILPTKKISDSATIRNTASKSLVQDLEKLMSVQKRFKDASLSLAILANELNTSEHVLSKALKESYNLTYSQYISAQRFEEAKKMLRLASENDTRIYEVMYEVGFNSKSAFNTWFKKNSGFTPTEYKKRF